MKPKKKVVRYFAVDTDSKVDEEASRERAGDGQKREKKKKKGGGDHVDSVRGDGQQQTAEGSEPVEVFQPNTSVASLRRFKQFGERGGVKKRKRKSKKMKELEKMAAVTLRNEAYPGTAKIPEKALKKFRKGKIESTASKSSLGRHRLGNLKKKQIFSQKQAARLEVVTQKEQPGYISLEDGAKSTDLTQDDIKSSVDLQSAAKRFDLLFENLGSYSVDYTRNGRFLLFAGSLGHVASIDWNSKKPMSEMNVMETVHDCKWFHNENYYAVAQKRWTYVYDNSGIEIHCLKSLDCVLRMEFIPHSFLLACGHAKGFLSFLDVSIGQLKSGTSTHKGRLDVMGLNPALGTVHLGHAAGVVSIWSPAVKNPLVEILCHPGPVTSVAVDTRGWYMATSGCDRKLRIWDLRMPRQPRAEREYGCLQNYRLHKPASALAFSQTGLLAAGVWKYVQVFKDCCERTASEPYLQHKLPSCVACPENAVTSLRFCPYEDVLGVGHRMGVSSLLVPGAGEPNFDALEANPYSTKRHRQHAEVNMLLEKVPAELLGDEVITKVVPPKPDSEKNLYYTKSKPRRPVKEGPLSRFKRH